MTSSGSEVSAKAVKPRRSRKATPPPPGVPLGGPLGPAGHDQLGKLGREKTLEPPQALELGHLLLDPLLQGPVPLCELNRLSFELSGLLLDAIVERLDPQHRLDSGDQR